MTHTGLAGRSLRVSFRFHPRLFIQYIVGATNAIHWKAESHAAADRPPLATAPAAEGPPMATDIFKSIPGRRMIGFMIWREIPNSKIHTSTPKGV